jgi:hypothetical protein
MPKRPRPGPRVADASPELGAVVERFEVDATDMRIFAWARGLLGLFALVSAGLLLASRVPVVIFGVAVLGVLIALMWLRQARVAHARARAPEEHSLTVHEHGLVLREGPRVCSVAWSEVRAVEVDEERLDIVLKRNTGDTLRVEPRYAGVALDELMRRLSEAWRRDGHRP